MALQATHFRIAYDLLPILKIQDLQNYYAGTLYPDSRYVTGLRREQTHGVHAPQDPFASHLTDFQKGWAVHLLYDQISGEYQKKLIPPDLLPLSGDLDEGWAYFMAIKLVEDIESFRQLKSEEVKNLCNVHCDPAPQHENTSLLRSYYTAFHELYAKEIPPLSAYRTYLQISVPPDRADAVLRHTEKILKNLKQEMEIQNIYLASKEAMISRALFS